MNNTYFTDQLTKIIAEFDLLKGRAVNDDLSGNIRIDQITELVTKCKATIVRITGVNSEYYKDIMAAQSLNIYTGLKLVRIIGVVKALKSDLENDYLKTFSEIIHSEIFADYLEMAYYLSEEGYKDPSAVLAGSTLESHLKQLCKNRQIPIEVQNNIGKLVPKKADLMNADLLKAQCYTLTYQKQITAWLDLRNNAAHGNYSLYTPEEVKLMIAGIRNFLLTVAS
jgi:hypothetical protein